MRILLARHGETAWNLEGRHQGRIDVPLSPSGEAQARALAGRLADCPITRAVASPLLRARRTAEIALGDRAGMLSLDPGFLELDHGAWEGKLASEVREVDPDTQRAFRETPHLVTLPGGESLADVDARAWPALRRASEGLGEADTLLILTHDGVVRVLVCRILGLSLARAWSFRQAPTGLTLLEGPNPEGLALVRLNDASHLYPLFGEANQRRL